MKRILGIVLCTAFLLSGCAHDIGNFTALSTGDFRGENINKEHLVKTNASVSRSTWYLLGVIPLGSPAKLDQVVSEALSDQKGDIMTNARVYHTWWYIILLSSSGYTVEGDVYRTIP